MTIIQPSRNTSLLNFILGGLVIVVCFSSLSLVLLYNRVVDMQHEVARMKGDMRTMQTESSLVRDKIFALFDATNFETLATSRALIKDREPQYLTIEDQWFLASH